MKPPLTYYGGKTQIAERIVTLLPAHRHYVEPFAGSLAVLLAKPTSAFETVNDLDGDLMAFWRVLRDRPADLERVCALTPHSRAEHENAYTPADDDVEQARRVWVRLTQGRAGTLRTTGWRHYVHPAGSTGMTAYLSGYVARIAATAARLARVSLECRPALDVIARYGQSPQVLLYVDPPYLRQTRTSTNYQYEMPTEQQHTELAETLRACRAGVVLSGYPSPLYDRLYQGWHRHEIRTATGQAAQWQTRTEVLWSNRAFPTNQHLFEPEVTV